jgi:hypothetical protein
MSKIITMLAALSLCVAAKAQTSEQRNLAVFNGLEIRDGITVIFTQDKTNSLTAFAGDPTELKDIVTEVHGNILHIYRKSNNRSPVRVSVKANGITSVKASGHSMIRITNTLLANEFFTELSSGSVFSGDIKAYTARIIAQSRSVCIGVLDVKTLFSDFSRGSYSLLQGTADKAMITANGESNCHNQGLVIKKAIIDASGNSFVQANVSDVLDIALDDNSHVNYYGEARTSSHSKNIRKMESYVVNGENLKNPLNN